MNIMNKKANTIFHIGVDIVKYFIKVTKYSASIDTDRDLEKMQYTILRVNHIMEKGMSMKNPRVGFGQDKVYGLLQRLEQYYNLYKDVDVDFLQHPLSTINQYIIYTEKTGVNIPKIKKLYNDLLTRSKVKITTSDCGITMVNKQDVQSSVAINYADFVQSRHAVRYYSKEVPKRETIMEALKIAQKTPSACNRQSWFAHIYFNEQATSLLKLQGGARGFEEEIPVAILVTANMKAYYEYEKFQAYIDGGLYAMDLIYALHSQGLGTIPLSCGFPEKKLSMIHRSFSVPNNEVLIMVIGVGELLENYKVAISKRKDIDVTTIWH